MKYSFGILFVLFFGKESFSQKELCINNVKSGRIIVVDPLSDVFFQLKSDANPQVKDPNDLSSIKIGKGVYHHGEIIRMMDNALVISKEISKGVNHIDTILLTQFTSIGKYRTGKGQKILGGVLFASSILFFAEAVKEKNKPKSALDKIEGTSPETLDLELGAISILSSAFCFIYPTHKEFVLGDKWNLSIRKHIEQN